MNPIWIIVLLMVSPFVTFLIVKYGAYGYFMAKRKALGKEVERTMKDQ